VRVRLDSGKRIEFSPDKQRHFDHGYALTSHSSQGLTADRVLVHVDTAQAHRDLINARMAYVSVSRARCDAHIYTNDAANLATELGRDVSKRSAIERQKETRRDVEHLPLAPEPAQTPERSRPQQRHIEPSRGFNIDRVEAWTQG
jgi:ATP-dependent exoDNAse (exonuclease V) alpha subunit